MGREGQGLVFWSGLGKEGGWEGWALFQGEEWLSWARWIGFRQEQW